MRDTIYSRFKRQVDIQPEATAIVEDGREVTYRELDKLADAIFAKFYDEHYRFVGIVMSHGIEMIAAMLAVLKSGAAYVLAEKSLPEDRRKYMMKTAGVKLVIDDEYCKDLKPVSKFFPDNSTPDGLAYILYTSGTTGRPKGVEVENHSVVAKADSKVALIKVKP